MQVLWIADPADGQPDPDPVRLTGSRLASQRLRIGIPARELAQAGFGQQVLSLSDPLPHDVDVDVAVFSKILPRSAGHVARHLEFAQALSARGCKVVVDVCDNHFGEAQFPYLPRLIALSDRVLANSPAMADIIATHTGREAVVIPDPVEMARQAPRFEPQARRAMFAMFAMFGLLRGWHGRIKLLWFGGAPQNYGYLRPWLPKLDAFAKDLIVDLHVVAAPLAEIEADLARYSSYSSYSSSVSRGLTMRFSPWSLPVMAPAFADCDLVFLPGDPADPLKTGVSTNRLAESVQSGRFVVASGMPSYWAFRDAAWIGDDLIDGLRWALGHSGAARSRIVHGQELIDRDHVPPVIGAAWVAALSGLKRKSS